MGQNIILLFGETVYIVWDKSIPCYIFRLTLSGAKNGKNANQYKVVLDG